MAKWTILGPFKEIWPFLLTSSILLQRTCCHFYHLGPFSNLGHADSFAAIRWIVFCFSHYKFRQLGFLDNLASLDHLQMWVMSFFSRLSNLDHFGPVWAIWQFLTIFSSWSFWQFMFLLTFMVILVLSLLLSILLAFHKIFTWVLGS